MTIDPALHELFLDHVPVARAGRLNIDAARRELYSLVRVVRAQLRATRDVPLAKQSAEVSAINLRAHNLRTALRRGAESVRQIAGDRDGTVQDSDGAVAHRLLTRLSRDLDALIDLTFVEKLPPQRGGAPKDVNRVRAAAECGAYWRRWTGLEPTSGDDSRFNVFFGAVLRYVGETRTKNQRGIIRAMLQTERTGKR